uniref:WYL domain-containing protein n=1 Tax=Streptomyces sp. KL118A TaxID=3045153 RepID=UPI00278C56F0
AADLLGTAGEPDATGRVTVTLPVENEDVAYTQLMSLGPEVEVVAPAELRARFADAAARIAELYR